MTDFADHLLPIDAATALRWGRLTLVHPHHSTDMMFAATALEHGLTLVTRNLKDFRNTGVQLLDPFSATSRI